MTWTSRPNRVVIGVPVLNGADHLEEAMDSLLMQSYEDFSLVVVDNSSTDATPDIVRRHMTRDQRVRYRRNSETVGMVENWRRTFRAAGEEFGDFEYFAFGSDHDIWHPHWLESLINELDADPAVVVAFPMMVPIRQDGTTIENWKGGRHWDTAGLTDSVERVRRVAPGMSVLNVAYGLYRARALERCGICPATLGPDRLLMTQLAVLGTFKQVPRELWMRRFWSPQRLSQRARLFSGRPPLHTYLPTGLVHAGVLFRWGVVERRAEPEAGRVRGIRIVGVFMARVVLYSILRWKKPFLRRKDLVRKRMLMRKREWATRTGQGKEREVAPFGPTTLSPSQHDSETPGRHLGQAPALRQEGTSQSR
jgi:glycosyl transferase family 2